MKPVILHIPHASTHIPTDERDLYTVSDDRLAFENLKLADLHTDLLYQYEGAARAVFPVSRFVVDAERFSDDSQEPMSKLGMGALYTAGIDLTPVRPAIPDERRRQLMDRYYWPHHNGLDQAAAERLNTFGLCLVFDCHSYPSQKLPYEKDGLARPQIGIGTDSYHTPSALADTLAGVFRRLGYEVGLDTPFSGALVPNAYYGKEKRVASIMIEVRRDLYMDETTGKPSPRFNRMRSDLTLAMQESAATFLT
jgi:N-formylglutamate deformylase